MSELGPNSQEYLQLIFLALQRIYDVQLALLFMANEEAAEELMRQHENLEYIGSFPFKDSDELQKDV